VLTVGGLGALEDPVDVAGGAARLRGDVHPIRQQGPGGAAPGCQGRNLDHFCISLEGPFDRAAIRAWLTDHGAQPGEETSRYGADGQGPSIYVPDPEGNVIELKGPPSSADR
jgi:hypothetical protein